MTTCNPELNTATVINLGLPHNVILFNDNTHDMDDVVKQIILAIHCGVEKAVDIMLEAHEKGRAIVFNGSLECCEHVENILSEIRLSTKIE